VTILPLHRPSTAGASFSIRQIHLPLIVQGGKNEKKCQRQKMIKTQYLLTRVENANTKVRRKRLEKLTSSAPSPTTPKPDTSSSPVPRARSESSNVEPVSSKEPEKITKEAPPPPPVIKTPPVEAPVISIEEWEDDAIRKILLVTLDVPSYLHVF